MMKIVGPPDPTIVGSRSDANSNSVVVRLTYGTFSVLFTGDVESSAEAWLIASGAKLRATVLKVAHHGSRYSSGTRFLTAVRPRIAIISVGAGNGYGHPSPETLARLESSGAAIYRTDEDGTTLEDWLRARGVDSVDVVGIATDYCVKATAADAVAAGFNTRVLLNLTAGVAPTSTAEAIDALRAVGVAVS